MNRPSKRTYSLLIGAILFLFCCFAFSACAKDTPDDTEDTLKNRITIDGSYAIIAPEKHEDVPSKLYSNMYRLLADRCPGISLSDDFYRDESEISASEILIGNTNRPESEVTFSKPDEFVVRMVNGKLVINAASVLALDYACQWFASRVETEGLTFAEDFSYIGNMEEAEPKRIAVADQMSGRVSVYDVSRGYIDGWKPLWYATPEGSGGAGLKYRKTEKYGEVVLSASGDKYAAVFRYPDGEKVWSTTSTADNPHSVEITPDGSIVAVASTTGCEVRFFNTALRSDKYTTVSLYDAHAVLYDPENECFWIAGGDQLCAYKVSIGENDAVIAEAIPEKQYTAPTTNIHDLQPVAGDSGKFWLSTGSNVYQVDKETGTFTTDYKNNKIINRSDVKGISSFEDGSVVFVYPDGKYKIWTSKSVVCSYILPFSEAEIFLTIDFPSGVHVYKVRAFVSDYIY